MVRAPELTAAAILQSLEKGDFYGSIGVVLSDIKISKTSYSLTIEPEGTAVYTTYFIGENGKILKEDYSLTPSYTMKGTEKYVRARVISSYGDFAITQPVFLKK